MTFEPIASLTPKPETQLGSYKQTLIDMGVGGVVAADFESRYRLTLTRSRWFVAASDAGMEITTRKVGLRLEIQRIR